MTLSRPDGSLTVFIVSAAGAAQLENEVNGIYCVELALRLAKKKEKGKNVVFRR